MARAEVAVDDDFRKIVIYGYTVVGICTELRPGKLRTAPLNDLDLRHGTLNAMLRKSRAMTVMENRVIRPFI